MLAGNQFSDDESEWESDASGEFAAAGFEADAVAANASNEKAAVESITAASSIAAQAGASANTVDFDAPSADAPVTSNQLKALIAMSAQPSTTFALNNGTGRVFIELSWNGTLSALKSSEGDVMPHLRSMNPQLASLLGGAKAAITTLWVHGFDNSDSPVSFGVSGDHMNGTKFNMHVCDTGTYMFAMPKRTQRVFDSPLEVFKCPESEFKKKMAAMYGSHVDETNIGNDVRTLPWLPSDIRVVPRGSPVLSGVKHVISEAKKNATEANEEFAKIDLDAQYAKDFEAFKLPAGLVTLGINVLTKWFTKSKDKVDVKKDFYLSFSRTSVSAKTLKEIGSRVGAQAAWEDGREVPVRSGQTLNNALIKPFDVKVTVSVPRPEAYPIEEN